MLVGIRNRGVGRVAGDNRPLEALYDSAIDRVMAVEQLGYDFFLIGEHHFFEDCWNPSATTLLAAMAVKTSRIRIGTNVILTPLYHPLRLAEDIAVIDNLSHGRVELVCGSASVTREFNAFGVEPSERFGRVWETMSFMRRAFQGGNFSHKGKYWDIPEVDLTTTVVQKPFPLWYGGFGPKMIEQAGKRGYHYFGGGAADLDTYYDALRGSGYDPDDFNLGSSAGSIICISNESERAEAEARAARTAAAFAAEYNEQGRDLAFQFRPSSQSPRSAAVIGTPDQILKALEPRLKTSRVTHLESGTGGNNPRIEELFAKEVLPTLKTWGRTPVTGKL